MSAGLTEQPAVGWPPEVLDAIQLAKDRTRLYYEDAASAVIADLKAKLANAERRAAAAESRSASPVAKTAFDCSALLALPARWRVEAREWWRCGAAWDARGEKEKANKMAQIALALELCINGLEAVIGRAGEANE